MASMHLCKPATSYNQTQSRLPTMSASTHNFIHMKTSSFTPRHNSRFSSFGLECYSPKAFCILGSTVRPEPPLRIGIVGLGAFGQFLANAFQRQGHNILATSRSDYSEYCQQHDIEFFRELNGLCEAQPDVLLICSSILSTENVVHGIPFEKLKPDTIIADVLSVKLFPKNLFLYAFPPSFGILCTHPMFGKFSGKNSWEGLRFVFEKVRIAKNSIQERNCEQFLSIFRDEGCKMVEMSCEEHDRYAAESQFLTHTVARILSNMHLEATPIDTKGYETLMKLTENTISHGTDLYDGLFLYNVNSTKQIKKLEYAFEKVKQNLFNKLRESYRQQIEETTTEENESNAIPPTQFLPKSENVLKDVGSLIVPPMQRARNTKKS